MEPLPWWTVAAISLAFFTSLGVLAPWASGGPKKAPLFAAAAAVLALNGVIQPLWLRMLLLEDVSLQVYIAAVLVAPTTLAAILAAAQW